MMYVCLDKTASKPARKPCGGKENKDKGCQRYDGETRNIGEEVGGERAQPRKRVTATFEAVCPASWYGSIGSRCREVCQWFLLHRLEMYGV